jgi:hypothetical protein
MTDVEMNSAIGMAAVRAAVAIADADSPTRSTQATNRALPCHRPRPQLRIVRREKIVPREKIARRE